MIYTITFNPSLDYVVQVPNFTPGAINRTAQETIYPGGKGVNVSLVLHNLGVESKALGFTAGFSGQELQRLLAATGALYDFIDIPCGYTRINVKIAGVKETAINGQGPHIGKHELEQLLEKLDGLQEGDILDLSGSIPSTLPNDVYEQIMQRVAGKGIKVVVDATGELVLRVLKYHPFLVKPNHEELGELFGLPPLKSEAEIRYCAKKLQELGACNVLVSRGSQGAILLDEKGVVRVSPSPKGKLVNSVGAGDSMVAGFLAGYVSTQDYEQALRWGICAGSASAFQEWLASKEDVEKLLGELP